MSKQTKNRKTTSQCLISSKWILGQSLEEVCKQFTRRRIENGSTTGFEIWMKSEKKLITFPFPSWKDFPRKSNFMFNRKKMFVMNRFPYFCSGFMRLLRLENLFMKIWLLFSLLPLLFCVLAKHFYWHRGNNLFHFENVLLLLFIIPIVGPKFIAIGIKLIAPFIAIWERMFIHVYDNFDLCGNQRW